ncbi:Trypanosomal VSG domain containing protein, putative [Trypanosoma equiperdum]|uniref:Trypanosomal VSG domain containing protein, putative n=1 Tax=Trypanosoma equiperdum TaxID=5694 RepID=A0A1G4HZJ7_TRYEQ|nr:Trypanosomal VSG domain containing protein, putative [Trypanosoma equiperdum]
MYPTVNTEAAALTAEEAKKTIAKAVTGEETGSLAVATDATVFGAAITAMARAQVCTAGNAAANPQTALAALACVCVKDSSDTIADGACTAKTAGASGSGWTSTGGNLGNTILTAIAKTCGVKSGPVTAAEIDTALQTIEQMIHTDATHGFLGAYKGTGCTGSSNAGICVQFTNLAAEGRPAIEKMQWLQKLKTLANQLHERQNTAVAAAAANNQLKLKATEAAAAIQRARKLSDAITILAHKPQAIQQAQQQTVCATHN